MRSAWRVLLTWLLVFAVPAQALTATLVRHCGPAPLPPLSQARAHDHADHHHARPGAGHETSADAGLQPAGDARHVHLASHRAADGELTAGPARDGAHEHGGPEVVAGSCSVCAACCLAAAPPLATIDLPPPVPASTPAASPTTAPPSHVGGRLERPPRLHLA